MFSSFDRGHKSERQIDQTDKTAVAYAKLARDAFRSNYIQKN